MEKGTSYSHRSVSRKSALRILQSWCVDLNLRRNYSNPQTAYKMCLIRTYLCRVYNSKKKVPRVMRPFPGCKEEQKGEKENVKHQFEFLAAVARNGRVWFSFQTTSDTVKQLINLLVDQKLIQMDCSRLGDRAVAETSRSFSVLLTDWKGIIVFVLAESEE